jgi:hypothetical protein
VHVLRLVHSWPKNAANPHLQAAAPTQSKVHTFRCRRNHLPPRASFGAAAGCLNRRVTLNGRASASAREYPTTREMSKKPAWASASSPAFRRLVIVSLVAFAVGLELAREVAVSA